MGDTTISWATKTWNVGRGCRRTAPKGSSQSGCGDASGGGCYAERQAYRFSGPGGAYEGLVRLTANGPRWTGSTRFVADHLTDPLRWRKPERIFVDSMSDMFYGDKLAKESATSVRPSAGRNSGSDSKRLEGIRDHGFTNLEIAAVFGVAAACPYHDFLILTKRAERLPEWFEWVEKAARECNDGRGMSVAAFCFAQAQAMDPVCQRGGKSPLRRGEVVERACNAQWPLINVWMGVSVENQAAADERIPFLLRTPAAIRFLSVEPLLGRVELNAIQIPDERDGLRFSALQRHHDDRYGQSDTVIDFVIAGCESGNKSRPLENGWLRLLREDCAAAGTKFFLKQAEETRDACGGISDGPMVGPRGFEPIGRDTGPIAPAKRKGKRKGGATIIERPFLDGRQHLELPE